MLRLLVRDCIELTPIEVHLIHFFSHNPNRCVSRGELLTSVWRSKEHRCDRVVDVAISKLRKKLDRRKVRLITIYGDGYRWLPSAPSAHPES